ncbi:MAG: tryptophan halogenase family protein [Asticcacaulis sp.]|uniref:tryptophan halogenase family protein n=1 Tax=Asticcacaulis sp. TaxID=1872648 RepID=UPI003F7B39FA
MQGQKVRKVVIAGGGTAGWCAAAGLSKLLGPLLDITLIESDDIGIVGVGEASIPTLRAFHNFLNIDEQAFMRATNATFKLGIEFANWAREGDRYFHAFGKIGRSPWITPFHSVWLEGRNRGLSGSFDDYSLELKAAYAGKFQLHKNLNLSYAYHFDATLYGQYLRSLSEAAGAKRIEGEIVSVQQNPETGFITSLTLASGQVIEGDLFIDCTGFRGLLIEQTLKAGYEDWSHWLPTDRAVAVQTRSDAPVMPYTQATAHGAGWRWRIPLQNRVGNGLIYCSAYLSDDEALERLRTSLTEPALTEPRVIRYKTGRRKKFWDKNCIAMGLSSGFIEPLESTSIHLFQRSVLHLAQNFPFHGVEDAQVNHYNDLSDKELAYARDFVILHYKLNERGEDFWRDRAAMAVPDSLQARIDLFRRSGAVFQGPGELFTVDSWAQVMLGQRLEPQGWHRFGGLMSQDELAGVFDGLKKTVDHTVANMAPHDAFVRQYAPSAAG